MRATAPDTQQLHQPISVAMLHCLAQGGTGPLAFLHATTPK